MSSIRSMTVTRATTLIIALAACVSNGACDAVSSHDQGAECPNVEPSVVTPTRLNASWRRNDAVSGMRQALVDESGVYYFDADGALFALPHGDDEPVQLLAPPSTPTSITGLVSDESTLYWGEAGVNQSFEPSPPPPPGSLHAMPKQGGDAELLVESDDATFTPLGVRRERVVVTTRGEVALLAIDGSGLEELEHDVPGEYPRFMDGMLYWTEPWEGSNDEVGYFSDVFRVDPLGGEVEELTRIEGSELRAGHGFVVSWQEREQLEPLVLDQNLVVFDEATGCSQPLPGVGLSVSSQAVIDARHAYWHSFNGLAGVSPGTPLEGVPLLRADLKGGELEELVTDGYVADVTHDTIGQTEDALYFEVQGALVVIDKPR